MAFLRGAAAGVLALAAVAGACAAETADTILVNGRIVTVDDRFAILAQQWTYSSGQHPCRRPSLSNMAAAT